MTVSNIGLLSGNYAGLNGLAGYGGYGGYGWGGGLANDGVATRVKHSVRNNYEINATRNSYTNMQGVEEKNYNQECQTILALLKEGRTDDATRQFNSMVRQMKNSPQYNAYSPSQLKSLIRENYSKATGNDILEDVNKFAPNGFSQGVAEGIPVLGTFFNQATTKDDLNATITNVPKNGAIAAQEMWGAGISGAIGGAAMGVGALAAKDAVKEGFNAYGVHGLKLTKILPSALKPSTLVKNFKGNATKWGLIGSAIGIALGLIKSTQDVK